MTDTTPDESAATEQAPTTETKPTAETKPPAQRRKGKQPELPTVRLSVIAAEAYRPSRHTDDVRHLQSALIAEGHLDGEPDGFYGGPTRTAVRAYMSATRHDLLDNAVTALGRGGRFKVVTR